MYISMYLAKILNWQSCSSVLSYGSCRIQLSKPQNCLPVFKMIFTCYKPHFCLPKEEIVPLAK